MELILLLILGTLAGSTGALTGVGGGILLVPVLNSGFGVDFRTAVGTSLVAVIATSSGSAANYLADDLPDIRLGMILEVATVSGAIVGGLVVVFLPVDGLRVLFGFLALYLAAWQFWSARFRVEVPYTGTGRPPVHDFPSGIAASGIAGFVSALLGIGGGVLKVPVMNLVMGLPYRVASATSNYMIGVTASASALLYFRRGDLDLSVTSPTVIGVLVGAAVGSRLMPRVRVGLLRTMFAWVVLMIAIQMFWRGFGIPSLTEWSR